MSKENSNAEKKTDDLTLADRLLYNPEDNTFTVNFKGYYVKTERDINEIEFLVAERLSTLGKKVKAIVDYEDFTINPEIVDKYAAMVNRVVGKYYSGVVRYTNIRELKDKLGESFKSENINSNIYDSKEAARKALEESIK